MQRIPVPSAPGRKARTEQECRDFEQQIKAKEAAAEKRKQLWNALNHFIRSNNRGWIVSAPGDPSVRIECEPFSDLPDLLAERFDLQPLGSRTRIEGGKFLPVLVYGLNLAPTRK